MTILEAILFADSLKPNAFTHEQKLVWLNGLEGRLLNLVHCVPLDQLQPYLLPDDENTVLLVPAPYSDVYWKWLCAMIDYANGEYDKYAASQLVANSAYLEYAKWVQRTGYQLGAQEAPEDEEVEADDPNEELEGVLPGA